MINKKTAEKILAEVKAAKRILLALHVSPDGDSLSSVLSLNAVLEKMGKKTQIISYSQLPSRFGCFTDYDKIKVRDFSSLDFRDFDIFVALDCADKRMITRSVFPEEFPKNFKIINIDHHATNPKFGKINLVAGYSSTAELLYHLFKAWKIKIDKKLAQLIFWGIVTDTGCFQYPVTSPETLLAAAELMEKGASLKEAVLFNFRSYSLGTLKYWGRVLNNLKRDESGKFVWSTVSSAEREELGVEPAEIEGAASMFAPVILGVEFGIILNGESEVLTRGSLRSRAEFDVSRLATELGGGGHKMAAGFSLSLPLPEAEKKVLETARKYIKN